MDKKSLETKQTVNQTTKDKIYPYPNESIK